MYVSDHFPQVDLDKEATVTLNQMALKQGVVCLSISNGREQAEIDISHANLRRITHLFDSYLNYTEDYE